MIDLEEGVAAEFATFEHKHDEKFADTFLAKDLAYKAATEFIIRESRHRVEALKSDFWKAIEARSKLWARNGNSAPWARGDALCESPTKS